MLTIPFKRCTAPHDDLDGDIGGPRSHAHTDALLSSGTITLQEAWDSYGIVGELLVSKCAFSLIMGSLVMCLIIG